MNNLEIFTSEEFGEIRTTEESGKILFVASDVATALGYSNPRKAVIDHCKGVTKRDTPTSSGIQEMSYIGEPDMYRLIMKSKLPSAEKFESWVMEEVLPSIRQNGRYEKPMSALEQIRLTQKAALEVSEKVEAVNKDLQEFKETIPLLAVDCDRITNAVKAIGTRFLGGHDSHAYQDKSLRQRVYSDIHREVKRQFGVTTYKAIRRNQCDRAVQFVNQYEIPFVMQDEIKDANSQERMFG